jgi:hypothetical protein
MTSISGTYNNGGYQDSISKNFDAVAQKCNQPEHCDKPSHGHPGRDKGGSWLGNYFQAKGHLVANVIQSTGWFVGGLVQAGANLVSGAAQLGSNFVNEVVQQKINLFGGIAQSVGNFFGSIFGGGKRW